MRKVCHTRRAAASELLNLARILYDMCNGVPSEDAEREVLQGAYGALEDYEEASYRDRQKGS